MQKSNITQDRLKSLLKYEQLTGEWTWLVTRNHLARAGKKAGWLDKRGYRIIEIDGKAYRSARLAYLYMTGKYPDVLVDHIDHNKGNDAWRNLREADHNENQYNQVMRSDNTSGVKGVRWHKESCKWRADIKFKGKSIYLGLFNTIDGASQAVNSARDKLHKEFSCDGIKITTCHEVD